MNITETRTAECLIIHSEHSDKKQSFWFMFDKRTLLYLDHSTGKFHCGEWIIAENGRILHKFNNEDKGFVFIHGVLAKAILDVLAEKELLTKEEPK